MIFNSEEDSEDEKIYFESGTVMSYDDIFKLCELLKRKIGKKSRKLQLEYIKESLESSIYYDEAGIKIEINSCNRDLNSLDEQIKEFIENVKVKELKDIDE